MNQAMGVTNQIFGNEYVCDNTLAFASAIGVRLKECPTHPHLCRAQTKYAK